VKIWRDSNGTMDKYQTKCKSIFEYKNIYLGDEYMIYSKYATMLQVIFVTMLYGIGIPMLFPICLLYLTVGYIFDRIDLASHFRAPPKMDGLLSIEVLKLLQFAPVVLLMNAFWVLTN